MKHRVVLAIFSCLLFAFCTHAQALNSQDDIQSWNDLQITAQMSKKVDFVTQITARLGKNISRLNDARYQIGFAFKPDKHWTFQPFYWFIKGRNQRGVFQTEHRYNLRIGFKHQFKKIALIPRAVFEYRIRTTGITRRFRPSVTIEKDLPAKFLKNSKFVFTDEVFYDSATRKFSRNRFLFGINKKLSEHLSVDFSYMRQNDEFARPGDLSVFWLGWRFKF